MKDACFGNNSISISQRRYLGSKTKLLSFIEEILTKEKVGFNSFADIFAGTGVVADYFSENKDVIVNDILDSNFQSYLAFFGKQKIATKKLLKKIDLYNNLDPKKIKDNYFSKNFSNTYFDKVNSKKIGFIREDIENEYKNKVINKREKAYLITSLIYALDKIANTVGHYDAYRKIDIPKKDLILKPLELKSNLGDVSIHREDANNLVRKIKADVVYIDPPYNSRQYSDAYHLLENIATWEKKPVHGVARKMNRDSLKSKYSMKSASDAFFDLINNLEAKYILVSYNDMGTNGSPRSQSSMSDYEIISALRNKGELKIFEKDFNQFTTGSSSKEDLKERIFFCKVKKDEKRNKPLFIESSNTHIPEILQSPLNYTGGKYRLIKQFKDIFPSEIDTFYDVFSGGLNVAINFNAKKYKAIEKNNELVNLLKYLKENNFEYLNRKIIEIISKHNLSQSYINGYDTYGSDSSTGLGKYNKNQYLKLRQVFNEKKYPKDQKYLHLLVLIFYSFNNQIRFNKKGEFNLPVGKRDYNGSLRRKLASFNAVLNLKDINIYQSDFRDIDIDVINKSDFVYLDPPYLLGTASYNESGGWTVQDENDLYSFLGKLNKKNIRFALSNVIKHKGEENHLLREFVEENRLKIHELNYNYNNSNYQSKAKKNLTQEVLITNY